MGSEGAIAEGSIAERYLTALSAYTHAETALQRALRGFFGGNIDWELRGDPYDDSLEVFVSTLPVERVPPLGEFVLALGFQRCWIHLHEGACDSSPCGYETYFYKLA